MLVKFFLRLRQAGVPVSIAELLSLLEGLRAGLSEGSADRFYVLARTCLVKDERHYDRYDRVFAEHFKGAAQWLEILERQLPADWLEAITQRDFTADEKAAIAAQGGWQALQEALRQRLEEQRERHEGGGRWIGTAGTSPFGAYGYNPEGVRIGQETSRQRSAVKVWDRREFANLDDDAPLGTRQLKLALRKLRRFARRGAATELALPETIAATARSGGWLDLKLVPERRNVVKVLLLLDVGGSMDEHVQVCEQLFSAARGEFKHLEQFYFHNLPYGELWRDEGTRRRQPKSTLELMRTYSADYKLILVGDATMSPYEVTTVGGSASHWNAESGATWLQRLTRSYPKFVWLNPQPASHWRHVHSIELIHDLLAGRMYPLTLSGVEQAIDALG